MQPIFFYIVLLVVKLAWTQTPPFQELKITYSDVYDDGNIPVSQVACASSPLFVNYTLTDLDSLPNWPNVGGGFTVTNSSLHGCGTCWLLKYNGTNENVAVLLIDQAASGLNIAKSTMNHLTNGNAEQLGVIYVDAEIIPSYEYSIHPLYGTCHVWQVTPAGKCIDKVGEFVLDEKRAEVYVAALKDVPPGLVPDSEDDDREITLYQYLFLRQGDGKSFAARKSAKLSASMGKLLVKITCSNSLPTLKNKPDANNASEDTTSFDPADNATSVTRPTPTRPLYYIFHFEYKDPYRSGGESGDFNMAYSLNPAPNARPIPKPAIRACDDGFLGLMKQSMSFHRDEIQISSHHHHRFSSIPMPSPDRHVYSSVPLTPSPLKQERGGIGVGNKLISHREINRRKSRSLSDISGGLSSENKSQSEQDSIPEIQDLDDVESQRANSEELKKQLDRVKEKYVQLYRAYKNVSRERTISTRDKSLATSKCLLKHSKHSYPLRLIHINNPSLYPDGCAVFHDFDPKRNREGFVPRKSIKSPSQDNKFRQKSNKIFIPPNIVLFHNPGSKFSVRAKKIIEDAQISFPHNNHRIGPALPMKLTIHERLPTTHEVKIHDAYFLLEEHNWTKFLNLGSLSYRTHPTNASSILEIVQDRRERRLLDAQEGKLSTTTEVEEEITEDESPDDPSLDVKPIVLPATHPLFGTECFAWPLILWNSDFAQIRPGYKTVIKRLHRYSRLRDNKLSPEELEAVKEEAKEKALQAKWASRPKPVSPDEGDTLEWYRESSNRKRGYYRENSRDR
ncbi:hypothetical protein Clacol_003501 [Clathrus columnatus]|uniref:Uncharacterized protein n=1 Tax=Clathrus columnatus TaxID=1419009 RepID=A0AAV5A959_9AGAM|nr:hypothetical protein Clacol_003501 [Clathrus columnatus]